MPHHVYANGNEICSKSANGTSILAIDVCFSPGAPMPGVPVTYMNTCIASDIARGSRTVLIKGKEVCLEDQSYFKKSYGDEPATQAMKRGMVSNSVAGKCRFVSWSANVFVEGLAVTRHLDLVTHNHNSPPNTAPVPYRSVWEKAQPCASDRAKVAKDCVEKKPPKQKRKGLLQTLKKIASIPDEAAQKALLYKRVRGQNGWVEDYCSGLWIKPMSETAQFNAAKEEIEKFLKQDKVDMLQQAFGELLVLAREQLGIGYVFRKAGGLVARSLVKNVIGGAAGTTGVGLAVTAAMAGWTVADIISTATTIARDLGPLGAELLEEVTSIGAIEDALKKKLQQWEEEPSRFMAELMSVDAAADACIRARKCMLVPFDKTDAFEAARSGEGCCPGQTGHHVMPGSMFGRRSNGTMDPAFVTACGKPYDHKHAPTICLEGVNNTHGSHGVAHSRLRTEMEDYQKGQKGAGPNGNPDRISYTEAREAALRAVKRVAPWCDISCLRAQLDSYYKNCDKGNTKNLEPSYGGGAKETAVTEVGNVK